MNDIINELKEIEIMNPISDWIKNNLDGQGAQDNFEILDDGFEDISRRMTDFSVWLDDKTIPDFVTKGDGNKFMHFELRSKDELLAATKVPVPEQMLVLQKLLDFAEFTVQCRIG